MHQWYRDSPLKTLLKREFEVSTEHYLWDIIFGSRNIIWRDSYNLVDNAQFIQLTLGAIGGHFFHFIPTNS